MRPVRRTALCHDVGTAWGADPGVLTRSPMPVAPPPTSPTTRQQPAAQPSLSTTPELRPSPTEMSIPQLLQYVVGADGPKDVPRLCTDCLALAHAAVATLPTGMRLWLQLELEGLSAPTGHRAVQGPGPPIRIFGQQDFRFRCRAPSWPRSRRWPRLVGPVRSADNPSRPADG